MQVGVLPRQHRHTVEEFFEFLDQVEGRYECHNGEVRLLESANADHSRINTDLAIWLGKFVLEGEFEPFGNDLIIEASEHNAFLLADQCLVKGKPEFSDEARRRLLNPSLLIEVISESSGDYDRGEKFQKYRSLESFKEYMLIDSRRYAVECWYKEEEKLWRMDSAFAREDSVYLHTLDIHLPLSEIYRRVHF